MATPTFNVLITDTGERYRCRSDQTVLAGMENLGRKGIPVGFAGLADDEEEGVAAKGGVGCAKWRCCRVNTKQR